MGYAVFCVLLLLVCIVVLMYRSALVGSIEDYASNTDPCQEKERSSPPISTPSSKDERFPSLALLLPAPRWGCVQIHTLTVKEFSWIYRRALHLTAEITDRGWAMEQLELMRFLESHGGWQPHFLASYDLGYDHPMFTVMDLILTHQDDPFVHRYWLSLIKGTERPSLNSSLTSDGLAFSYPLLWKRHLDGLKCVVAMFEYGETVPQKNSH